MLKRNKLYGKEAEIRKRAANGEHPKDMAPEYGVHDTQMYKFMRDRKIKYRKRMHLKGVRQK